MNRRGSYFGMQMKRMLRLLPVLLAAVAATFAVLGLCAALLLYSQSNAEGKHRFRIGMVGNSSDSYLGFGISVVQAMDDSRFMVELVPMEKEEALESFRRGELSACVLVPDGLLDSIVYGRNDELITYLSSEGQKGLEGILGEELADIVSVLVTRSQSAIFGMQQIMGDHGRSAEVPELTDLMNLKLFDIVLNRTGLYTLEELGVSGGLSAVGYYLGAFLVFFLLLLGIHASPLFIRRSRALPELMKSRGVGVLQQVLGEYGAFACMNLVCFAVAFFAVGMVLKGGFLAIPEWEGLGMEPLGELFPMLLPVALMLAAMQFWLYELVTGVAGSLICQFVCCISMAYLGGVFYPSAFFPETMKTLGQLLPAGMALRYVQDGIRGELYSGRLVLVCTYCVLFLGLSVLTRELRLEKGRRR
ncbi:MAG: ABC transporter permease [Firmicutes bacterium]|nr:ABC transporter permease [Bacillota bacterium]